MITYGKLHKLARSFKWSQLAAITHSRRRNSDNGTAENSFIIVVHTDQTAKSKSINRVKPGYMWKQSQLNLAEKCLCQYSTTTAASFTLF